MKIRPLRKALLTELYLKGLAKAAGSGGADDKPAYFKQQILAYLKQERDKLPLDKEPALEKAVYGIGTIRTWKGKKFIKGPDKKWRRYYEKEERGTRRAIGMEKARRDMSRLHIERRTDKNGHIVTRWVANDTDNTSSSSKHNGNIKQTYTSEGTSLKNNYPSVFKYKGFTDSLVEGEKNFDIGAGKTEVPTQILKQNYGVTNITFDPFNRDTDVNRNAIESITAGKRYKTVTIANVLNVIDNPESRSNVILQAAKATAPEGKAFFQIHNAGYSSGRNTGGNKYQTSMKPAEYVHEIKKWFDNVELHGSIIIASRAKPSISETKAEWWLADPSKGGEIIFKSIKQGGIMKLLLRKSTFGKLFFKESDLSKAGADDTDKLAYFKKLILERLESTDDDSEHSDAGGMEKAGYPVGTVREWKGQKFIKVAPNKWRPKYDTHNRDAKMAISAIKRKVDHAKTAKELMDIVMENRDRFSDSNGRPLPFVHELSEYVAERGDAMETAAKKEKGETKPKSNYTGGAKDQRLRRVKDDYAAGKIDFERTVKEYMAIYPKLSKEAAEKTVRGQFKPPKKRGEGDGAARKSGDEKKSEKAVEKEPKSDAEKQKNILANRIMHSVGYKKLLQSLKDEAVDLQTAIKKIKALLTKDRKENGGYAIQTNDGLIRLDDGVHNIIAKPIYDQYELNKKTPQEEPEKPADTPPLGSDDSQDSEDFNAIREKYQEGKSVEGNNDEIYIGDEAVEGHWKLVEANAPTASHDENSFHKTRGFPKNKDGSTINDRDYANDRTAQEIVITMGGNFDGRALSFDSPVVVTQDGIVISGNNRAMSGKIAARRGSDALYIDALKKRASRFGFSPDDIGKFKHPRVVFEIEKSGGYSTAEFAKYNQESQKSISPIEQAVKVSKIMKAETVKEIADRIGEFDTMGELYADHKACANIYNALENAGIVNQFSRNSYIDLDGVITGAGKEFLETALLGSIVNEKNIRGLNREGCKSIRQKLARAITPLVNNKAMGGYSITDELNQAIDLCMQFNLGKDKFGSLDDLANQGAFFEEVSKVGLELARKMQMNQKDFACFMRQMNASLEVGSNGQSDIFIGDIESKDDILKRMLDLKKAIANVIANLKSGVYGPRFENVKTAAEVKKALATPSADDEPPIYDVAIDFDGVINSYKSGWQGADKTDEPVAGAADRLNNLLDDGFKVVIYSTRSETAEGEMAIKAYLRGLVEVRAAEIAVSKGKPIATVYVDDRAVTFTGDWGTIPERIGRFKSWVDKSFTWSGHKLQGRTKLHGMDISIENKKKSVRSGTDKNGHEWRQKLGFDYGYIRGTVGKDKDHVDCFIGPNPKSEKVFVIHQVDPYTDGNPFDEDKVMLGWDDAAEAKKAYIAQYDRPDFFGSMDAMGIDEFKEKAYNEKYKGKMLK